MSRRAMRSIGRNAATEVGWRGVVEGVLEVVVVVEVLVRETAIRRRSSGGERWHAAIWWELSRQRVVRVQ